MSVLEASASTDSRIAAPGATEIGSSPTVEEFFEARGADVDRGDASVREGLAFLGQRGFGDADIERSIDLVSTVSRSDLASAFSAWAHRMVIDYISLSPDDSSARDHLPALATADTMGATALAAGTAHVLAGTPLPVSYQRDGDEIVLDGRIPWASNLIAPYVVVCAAAGVTPSDAPMVVAISSDAGGLEPAPFPDLLALNATGSTTVKLDGVRVPSAAIVSWDLGDFCRGILARFLLLQGAFCSGLAARALEEAEANLGPMGDPLREELATLAVAVAASDEETARLASHSLAGTPILQRDLLALRLRWTELATAAVHLESAATGGRGYLTKSPTARRVREVAFLPIQAPTEVLLRWLLSHSE